MKTLSRLASARLFDDAHAFRAVQMGAYAASPAVLFLALVGLARMDATRAEILIGVLAAGSLAVGLATLGTLAGLLAELRRRG